MSASTLSRSADDARSKKLRACAKLGTGWNPYGTKPSPENRGRRVGARGLFGASRLGGDERDVQRARQARDDFVLHVEEIGERLVEPFGPEVIARFGVDELHVDAHAVSAALNAAHEDITDVQFAPDRLHVERLALVGERRIAGDHDGATNPREVGRQALRDPVDEMLLLRVAADIGEGQNDDREARRALSVRFGSGGRGRGADLDREGSHRPRDVLERLSPRSTKSTSILPRT